MRDLSSCLTCVSGNFEAAIAAWTEAMAVDPENKNFNTSVLSNRASAYMKLKKYEEAVNDLSKVIEEDVISSTYTITILL